MEQDNLSLRQQYKTIHSRQTVHTFAVINVNFLAWYLICSPLKKTKKSRPSGNKSCTVVPNVCITVGRGTIPNNMDLLKIPAGGV